MIPPMTSAGRREGRRAGTVADSMTEECSDRQARGADLPDPCTVRRLLLGLHCLGEHQLAALDGVRAVERERGVTVLVDLVRPEDAVLLLGREERVHRLLAVAATLRDGVEHGAHGLIAVHRIRIDLVLRL